MSVENQNRTVAFSCDSCSDYHEGDPGDSFNETWEVAKRAGFVAFKVGSEWCHSCPTCKDKVKR